MSNKKLQRASSISNPYQKIVDVPDAPTVSSITATDVGTSRAYNSGAATVTFAATSGATGGIPSQYTVTSTPGSFTATGISPLTVTGLSSATAYTFSLAGNNTTGTGSPSSTVSSSITATTVPAAPTIGTVTDGGTGTTVSIPVTAGATGGKSITGYSFTSSPTTTTQTSATVPYTFTGLTAGTAYTFQAATVNANGTSSYSSASNSVTPIVPSNFFSIATVTAAGGETSLSFTSIPSTYSHLQIRVLGKNTSATTSLQNLYMVFNSDATSADFVWHQLQGNGGTVSASSSISNGECYFYNMVPSSSASFSNMYGVGIIDILDYASTVKNKTVRSFGGFDANLSSTNYRLSLESNLWINTAALSNIAITSDTSFAAGATLALYGVK